MDLFILIDHLWPFSIENEYLISRKMASSYEFCGIMNSCLSFPVNINVKNDCQSNYFLNMLSFYLFYIIMIGEGEEYFFTNIYKVLVKSSDKNFNDYVCSKLEELELLTVDSVHNKERGGNTQCGTI